jgi:hypothetical protein
MAPVNRQFTYKRRIKVSGDDFTLAKNGTKICTIRLGVAKVEGEFVDLSDELSLNLGDGRGQAAAA